MADEVPERPHVLSRHSEYDRVFRTHRPTRCRTVHQNRSTWQVIPAPLAGGRRLCVVLTEADAPTPDPESV